MCVRVPNFHRLRCGGQTGVPPPNKPCSTRILLCLTRRLPGQHHLNRKLTARFCPTVQRSLRKVLVFHFDLRALWSHGEQACTGEVWRLQRLQWTLGQSCSPPALLAMWTQQKRRTVFRGRKKRSKEAGSGSISDCHWGVTDDTSKC